MLDTEVVFEICYKVTKIYPKRCMDGSYRIDIKVESIDGYLRKKDIPQKLSATGKFSVIHVGDHYKNLAKIVENQSYGYSLRLIDIPEEILPSTEVEVARYISDHVQGVGKKSAARIVEALGPSAITKISKDPNCIMSIESMTERQKIAVQDWCKKNTMCESVLLYLCQAEIPLEMARSIYERYGDLTITTLMENPYAIYESGNIPYFYAEKIAAKNGIPWNDPRRIECAVRAAIDDRIDRHGDTCVTRSSVIGIAESFIRRSRYYPVDLNIFQGRPIFSTNEYERAIQMLLDSGELVPYQRSEENGGNLYYYRKQTFYLEKVAAQKTIQYIHHELALSTSPAQIRRFLRANDKAITEEQIEGVVMAATHGLSVLTGGPGTGKTYTVRALVETLRRFRPDIHIVQVAPTAKAASKMREVTQMDSDTIHSAYKLGLDCLQLDQGYIVDADFVIVDESSMIGIQLFCNMLLRSSESTSFLFVGDPAQLPSIDCGDVLHGLIMSKVVPCTELSTVHRQAEQSTIVTNAHLIRSKSPEKIRKVTFNDNDFLFIGADTAEQATERIIEQVEDLVLKRHVPLDDVMILTPVHSTLCGTDVLNSKLQDLLNPVSEGALEFRTDDMHALHVGDRVVNTKNFSYETEKEKIKIKNGDIGHVTSIDEGSLYVTFDAIDVSVRYTRSMSDRLDLAYAMTVHRSQGSEADYVILPCINDRSHRFMLNNALIYTAVTRAKKRFVCVGSEEVFCECCIPKNIAAIRKAIHDGTVDQRMSLFPLFLRKEDEGRRE